MYEIEKNVPLSPHKTKYPWNDMVVGDSFLVKPKNGQTARSFRCSISALASHRGKMHNEKYTTREINGNIRIWRVE